VTFDDNSMKGVFQIFCIFNENLISLDTTRHVRQFREDRDGNHYPLLRDGKAIIHVCDDGLYKVKTIDDEVIAISDDYSVAYRRAMYADRNAKIQVNRNGGLYDVDEQGGELAPIVFRINYYEGMHGFVAAIDVIKYEVTSDPEMFYNKYDLRRYILHESDGRNDYLVTYSREPIKELEGLGSDRFINEFEKEDYDHLREVVDREVARLSWEAVKNE